MKKQNKKSKKPELQWSLIILLGAIGSIRPLVHDIPALADNRLLQGIVAISVFATMLIVPIIRKVPNPFTTLVAIGGVYGVLSAIVHQIMWNTVFEGGYPTLGPDATFDPPVWFLRFFAVMATLTTSLITGAILGATAHFVSKATYNKA